MAKSLKIETLRKFVNAGDRIGYYTQLTAWGDRYAPLALGVVTNETLAGATANIFFLQKNLEKEWKLNWDQLAEISVQLMIADFNAREGTFSDINPVNLSVDTIWRYHEKVFGIYGISSDAWTVDFVLNQIPDLSQRQTFWNSLLESAGGTSQTPSYINKSTDNISDYIQIMRSSISPNILGYADYVVDLTLAGALALSAPSTDYGPYSVRLSKAGLVASGNWKNDTLMDGDGDDVLLGFDGDDRLLASTGNDRIYGGPDNDLIVGGDGDDMLIGGDGNDTIYAGTVAKDRLQGFARPEDAKKSYPPITLDSSFDFINSGSGNDNVYIGGGNDIIILGDGNDTIYMEQSYETITSVIWGGDGADNFHIKSNAVVVFLQVPVISENLLMNVDIDRLKGMYNFGHDLDIYRLDTYFIINFDDSDSIYIDGEIPGTFNAIEKKTTYQSESLISSKAIGRSESRNLKKNEYILEFDETIDTDYEFVNSTGVSANKIWVYNEAYYIPGNTLLKNYAVSLRGDHSTIHLVGFRNGMGGIYINAEEDQLLYKRVSETTRYPIKVDEHKFLSPSDTFPIHKISNQRETISLGNDAKKYQILHKGLCDDVHLGVYGELFTKYREGILDPVSETRNLSAVNWQEGISLDIYTNIKSSLTKNYRIVNEFNNLGWRPVPITRNGDTSAEISHSDRPLPSYYHFEEDMIVDLTEYQRDTTYQLDDTKVMDVKHYATSDIWV